MFTWLLFALAQWANQFRISDFSRNSTCSTRRGTTLFALELVLIQYSFDVVNLDGVIRSPTLSNNSIRLYFWPWACIQKLFTLSLYTISLSHFTCTLNRVFVLVIRSCLKHIRKVVLLFIICSKTDQLTIWSV